MKKQLVNIWTSELFFHLSFCHKKKKTGTFLITRMTCSESYLISAWLEEKFCGDLGHYAY